MRKAVFLFFLLLGIGQATCQRATMIGASAL